MVFGWIVFAVQVITKEIVEDIHIIKEVISYHVSELSESRQQSKQAKKMKRKMENCDSYEEWLNYASLHDNLKVKRLWRNDPTSRHYNYEYIAHLRDQLKDDRINKRVHKIIHTLRSHAFRNIGNILNPALQRNCVNSSKDLIEEFQNEVDECIMYIATTSQLEIRRKMEFFLEMRHAVGRTALILSGGGLMGMYHAGVIKILSEQKLMPKIISGSSAGSIIAAFLCTRKSEEFPYLFNDEEGKGINWNAFAKKNPQGQIMRKIKRIFEEGVLLDVKVLEEFIKDNIGDITFQEAYDKTGMVLNITVTGEGSNDQDRVLNYLSSPNVIIWSAVCCSCGIPYIYGSSDLLCKNEKDEIIKYLDKNKKFVDGSIGADLPLHRLSEYFNVNSFIVSQTNPWVVPFIDNDIKITFWRTPIKKILFTIFKVLNSEVKHRCQQIIDFHLLPKSLQRGLNIILQNYEGHITVAPVPRWSDYANILEVLRSQEDFVHFIKGGEVKTYMKIPAIRRFSRYENSLAEGYARVKSQLGNVISGQDIELEMSVKHDSGILNILDDDDDDNEIKEDNQKQGQQRMRNYSFTIPRSKSKDILEKLNAINIKSQKNNENEDNDYIIEK